MEDSQHLQQTACLDAKIIPTPLVVSPNADPHAKLPPLRRKSSTHVFYNYTQPTSPIPKSDNAGDRIKIQNLINPDNHRSLSPDGAKYLLPEPAVSIAYRHNLDAQF